MGRVYGVGHCANRLPVIFLDNIIIGLVRIFAPSGINSPLLPPLSTSIVILAPLSSKRLPRVGRAPADRSISPAAAKRLVERDQVLVQAGIALDKSGLREVQSTL